MGMLLRRHYEGAAKAQEAEQRRQAEAARALEAELEAARLRATELAAVAHEEPEPAHHPEAHPVLPSVGDEAAPQRSSKRK